MLMQPCVDAGRCFENFPELRGAGDLVNHFHLTLEQAAKTREISVTGLKRICRERGVERWPCKVLQSMRPKCHTSGLTAPVVKSVDECPSCAIVPVDERVTGAPADWWLMQPADGYSWWTGQFIVNMLTDLPPRNSHDPPPPSPPDRPTLPAARLLSLCHIFIFFVFFMHLLYLGLNFFSCALFRSFCFVLFLASFLSSSHTSRNLV